MADSLAFEWICDRLLERTSLDRLEARGTVRLALKQAGLEARSVDVRQMLVILEKVLPAELAARDVDDGEGTCRTLAAGLAAAQLGEPAADSPDEVFRRLGGS